MTDGGRSPGAPAARLALALAAGALWGLCFGRQPLVVAPWVALAPLGLLLGAPRPAASGFVFGLGFWLSSISWLGPTLETYGGLPPVLAWPVVLALCAGLAVFCGVFGLLGARLWRLPSAAAIASAAALWVALEWIREHHFITGFPWNLPAYAWIEVPGALELSAWVGSHGVSFLVVAANLSLARAVAERKGAPALWGVGLCLVALAWGARWAGPQRPPAGEGLAVRVVQPDIENLVEWDPRRVEAGYRRLLDLSHGACDEPGALVVWPESAGWPMTYQGDARLRGDLGRLAAAGCRVLFNTPTGDGGGWDHNSALLVDGSGVAGRYDKRHLVPFGEYVPQPFRLLPFVGKLARHAGDFRPGSSAEPIAVDGERLALSICYEVIFPAEVAAAVRRGATLLVTLTNDAWYGDTAAPRQHLRAARFRAAESRRPLVRAAVTGISAIVGADGGVVSRLGVGERGVLRARLAGDRRLTPASRRPWLVPLLCSLVAASAILPARRGGGARRRR